MTGPSRTSSPRATTSRRGEARRHRARHRRHLRDGCAPGDHQRVLSGPGIQAGRLPPAAGECRRRHHRESEAPMAEIVMAYAAAHAPMMTADPGSAPRQQAENFFGALEKVRDVAKETDVQAIVMMTGEHFTNFFLDGLPQIAIGLDDEHLGPPEVWLQVPKKMVPSDAGLAAHITASPDRAGPAAGVVLRDEDRPRLHDRVLLARQQHGTADGADRAELHDSPVDDDAAVLRFRSHAGQRHPLLRRAGAGRTRCRRRVVALRRRAAGR